MYETSCQSASGVLVEVELTSEVGIEDVKEVLDIQGTQEPTATAPIAG